jgi:hypothetical protein
MGSSLSTDPTRPDGTVEQREEKKEPTRYECVAASLCKDTAMLAGAADGQFRQNMPVCRQKPAGIWQGARLECRYGGSKELLIGSREIGEWHDQQSGNRESGG